MTDKLTVTDADRHAAAAYLIAAYPEAAHDPRVHKLREGKKDTDPAAIAFARHRALGRLQGLEEAAGRLRLGIRLTN